MANPALVEWIRKYFLDNDDEPTIRQRAREAGYSDQEFTEALLEAKAPPTPPVPGGLSEKPPFSTPPQSPDGPLTERRPFKMVVLLAGGAVLIGGSIFLIATIGPTLFKKSTSLTEETTRSSCVVSDSEEKNTIKTAMTTLEEQVFALSEQQASDYEQHGDTDSYWTYWDEINSLSEQYNELELKLTQLSLENLHPGTIDTVYAVYCEANRPLVHDAAAIDGSQAVIERVAYQDIEEILCALEEKQYENEVVHQALNQAGFYLMQAGHFDKATDFYTCAAEQYHNPTAMYRLAQLYTYGSEVLQQVITEAGITLQPYATVQPDLKTAYYWITAHIWVARYVESPHLDTGTNLGWNSIALLNSLQQSPELSDQDLIDAEADAMSFLAPRFPQIRSETSRVYSHSMRAIIDTLSY